MATGPVGDAKSKRRPNVIPSRLIILAFGFVVVAHLQLISVCQAFTSERTVRYFGHTSTFVPSPTRPSHRPSVLVVTRPRNQYRSPHSGRCTIVRASRDDSASNSNKNYGKDISSSSLSSSAITTPHSSERIRDNWKDLYGLTRPKNFPGVVLFHMTGVYLAMQSFYSSTGDYQYWTFLIQQPMLWLTLICLLLVDSTSMVINDYYDAKLGRDVVIKGGGVNGGVNGSIVEGGDGDGRERVLVSGKVSFATTKRFVSYLYAIALILLTFLPGIATRLSVVLGLVSTYLYTQHMKPLTWLKNVTCASLIALAPWTSASATLHILAGEDTISLLTLLAPTLQLVFAIFAGIMAREIIMDCDDVETDRPACVRTVPVRYGKEFAANVAFIANIIMSLMILGTPMAQLMDILLSSDTPFTMIPLDLWRRLGFGIIASSASLFRGWKVLETKGDDVAANQKFVDEGLIIVVFLLLSFL